MPRRSPFTRLCSQLAALDAPSRADLHIHTTASDGEYTASQVIALARQTRLHAVAITDHDTLAGVAEARDACATLGAALEFVPGVEISTSFCDREFHLLGYFVRTDCAELNAALATVCESRRVRFREFVSLLRDRGHAISADRVAIAEQTSASLGRRNVANLLVACGIAKTRTEAFHRFVGPLSREVKHKTLVPLADAIALVHVAGGVASLAHPPANLVESQFAELRDYGLDALEAVYPWGRNSPELRWREVAAQFGFAVTGGSDCHGSEPAHRRVGSHGVNAQELAILRDRIGCAIS